MLNNDEIIDAIKKKEIEITISFELNDNNICKLNEEKSIISTSLSNNIYSDRLKLTMGPIIKKLNSKHVPHKYRFKSHPNCFDLSKSGNTYYINPGESITILTNEKIKLNGKYSCLIIPRVSMSDVGIVVTPAYIDPYYHGLLRLHLTNFSNQIFKINTLESIAQCFFFRINEIKSPSFKENFATKSVFYGQTWKEIYESDRDPFPIKKQSICVDKKLKFKETLINIICILKKSLPIISIAGNTLVLLLAIYSYKLKFDRYFSIVEQIKDFTNKSASEIIIEAGQFYGEKTIEVSCKKSEIITILLDNNDVHYKILSSDTEDVCTIIFSYYLATTLPEDCEIDFSYTIIRSIN